MCSIFTSCFGMKPARRSCNPSGLTALETPRVRSVLVRPTSEKQVAHFKYNSRSASNEAFFADLLVDEKIALNDHDRESLLTGYDEDREEYTTAYLSEKQVEARFDGDSAVIREKQEEVEEEKHLFHRRGILYKPKKKLGKAGSPPPLESQHTSDELQRRLDVERKIKKMSPRQAEREWEIERARRRQWEAQRKNAKAS